MKISLLAAIIAPFSALFLTACSSWHPGHMTMMGEHHAPPAAGEKMLVGKLEVRDPSGTAPWDGNVEICMSPVATPDKLTCGRVTFKRAECATCTSQPDFETDKGFVFMPMPPGLNELREIRLTHFIPVIGKEFYTFYTRGHGFDVDPNADITNFGTIVFAMVKPASGNGMGLKLADIQNTDTAALTRYLNVSSTAVAPTVSKQAKPYFVNPGTYRQQVKVSRLQQTYSSVPIYIPVRR